MLNDIGFGIFVFISLEYKLSIYAGSFGNK